jgi:nitrogen fixation protein
MLVRPLVVVGCAEGAGALHWLANGEVLLAVQGQWPKDTRIPALVLANQITPQTRLQAVGAGILAVCAPSLGRHLGPEALYRIWLRLLDAKLNPLTAISKMGFARTMGCDSRRLPAARPGEATAVEEA